MNGRPSKKQMTAIPNTKSSRRFLRTPGNRSVRAVAKLSMHTNFKRHEYKPSRIYQNGHKTRGHIS